MIWVQYDNNDKDQKFKNFPNFSWKLRFGDVNLKTAKDDEFVQEVKISKITNHPQYTEGVAYFDIAVLEIEAVKFNANVRTICLPSSVDFKVDKFNQVKCILFY